MYLTLFMIVSKTFSPRVSLNAKQIMVTRTLNVGE